jgi:hypothetical protein
MRPQLIMFCYGVFIIGTILSVVFSKTWLGDQETDIINQIAGFSVVNIESLGGWAIPKQVSTWFDAIITILSWSYPYLESTWATMLKYVILYPVTIGVVITLVELASTVLQGIASTVRSLIPG